MVSRVYSHANYFEASREPNVGSDPCMQFWLLLMKNVKVLTRQKLKFFISVIVGFVVIAILALTRAAIEPTIYKDPTIYKEIKIDKMRPVIDENSYVVKALAFCPENEILQNVIKKAAAKLNLDIIPTPNADILRKEMLRNKTIVGIVFDDKMAKITVLPRKVKLKLKFYTKGVRYSSFFLKNWRTDEDYMIESNIKPEDAVTFDLPPYFSSNFITIQHAVTMSYIEALGSDNIKTPEIVMQQFPHPPYQSDEIGDKLTEFYLLVMILFAFPSAHIASIMSYEKRQHFRTFTAVMGVSNWVHWLAWFVCSFLYLMMFAIVLIIVLRVPIVGHRILNVISDSVLIIFFVIYVISVITFTFMMSAGFSRKNIGYLMNLMIWIPITVTIYIVIDGKHERNLGEVIILNLYMNLALGEAIKEAVYHNNLGSGITWTNMWLQQSLHPYFCFGHTLIFIFSSSIVYFLIALLIHKFSPGRGNIKEGWSISEFYDSCIGEYKDAADENILDTENFQTVDYNRRKIGVEIRDLRKTFKTYVAVNNITMNIYKDEVTVILTDLGGGKTVTIALMTGILNPTRGTVLINGQDIQSDWKRATSQIGYYPSFDYFFEELTVIETMMLFSKLKGAKSDLLNEIIKYTNLLGIGPHLHSSVQNLSPMDRMKLAMCNAFCGGSKVIICDDSDLDLDPMSSEGIWDLLQMEKYGKTIIVFTSKFSHMDLSADRIAIMFRGALKGYGDLAFLRKRLNGGYILKLKKSGDDFSSEEVTKFLTEFDSNIYLDQINDSYVQYVLSESNGEILKNILQKLNISLNKLKISDFELHLQPLEELMLSSVKDRLDPSKRLKIPELQLYTGDKLRTRQWRALLYKKFVFNAIYIKRFVGVVFTLAIIAAVFNYKHHRLLSNFPEYEIGFDNIKGKGFLEYSGNSDKESPTSKLAREYKMLLTDIDLINTNNMESLILNSEEKMSHFHKKYLIAATIKDGMIKAWFNNFIYHTPPLALNIIHNAIARAFIGNDSLIQVVNAPTRLNYQDLIKMETDDCVLAMYHFCVLGMAFVTPLFLHDLVRERLYRYKAFLLHSGVSSWTYWASSFTWDCFVFIIISVVLVLFIGCGEMNSSYVLEKLGMYLLIFIIFGLCAIAMTYLIFQIWDARANKLYVYNVIINIITGFGLSVVRLLLRRNHSSSTDIISWIFKIFPHYNLAESMRNINAVYEVQHYCEMICIDLGVCKEKKQCKMVPECCQTKSIMQIGTYGIGDELLYFIIVMIVCLILVFLCEFSGFFSHPKVPRKRSKYKEDFGDDSAREEKFRILSLSEAELDEHPLVMDRVSKYYGNFQVLNQVTFGVKEGELLGLVGSIGAGKSTIFKIINGQEQASTGDVYFWGSKIDSFTAYGTEIGHSPQNIGFPAYLSGRDALQICGLIHGVKDKDIENICNNIAKYLGFTGSLNKDIGTYDLNVKRKLMIAMAVIGNTSLILLDQPTEACAPAVRMKIWDFVVNLNQTGRTILFSSESIYECLQICSRIVVIANGEIIGVGTPEEFKQQVQAGIDLIVKIIESKNFKHQNIGRSTRVKRLIERAYPDAYLRMEHYGMLMYFIPYKGTDDWVNLVSLLEKHKEAYKIRSYYLTKTNIDVMIAETAKKQKCRRCTQF